MTEFIEELWAFLRHRKKFWLLPLIIILLIMGMLMIVAGGSALSPFIYSIF